MAPGIAELLSHEQDASLHRADAWCATGSGTVWAAAVAGARSRLTGSRLGWGNAEITTAAGWLADMG